jgi:TonB family protein
MRAAAHGVRIDAGNQQCRPVYPHVAEREGVTGITKVRITIDATGRVSGAQILEPSGKRRENRNMDQAAIEALSQCPVAAGVDELGRPVGGAVDINYKWSIL